MAINRVKRRTHSFTPEQCAWLRDNVAGRLYAELAELFNACFGTSLGRRSIQQKCMKLGLSNGMKGKCEACRRNQFKAGFTPWNKGVKGCRGANGGSFRPGNVPWKQRPVGSLRRSQHGFYMIKVADPNEWRLYHHVLYEWEHGPLPPGMNVIFADGDRNNIDPSNLLAVSLSERICLDKNGLRQPDADLTRAGLALAKLRLKLGERMKERP